MDDGVQLNLGSPSRILFDVPNKKPIAEKIANPDPPSLISELEPDRDNHNKGTERGTAFLEDSLRRNGFGRPILIDKNKKVIGGNQVLQGAINAGLIKLRIIKTRGNEVIAHMREDVDLDTKVGREMSIADNFSHEASFSPDAGVLARQIEDNEIELRNIGISEDEFRDMLAKAIEAEVDTDVDRKIDRKFKGSGVKVKAVFVVEQANEIERAILLTGIMNRGDALVEICRQYEKRQHNPDAEGGAEA